MRYSQGIPVVNARLGQKGKPPVNVTLLMDTGADVPFSLHSIDGFGVQPPPDAPKSYISEGIKGNVYGQWSRVDAIQIGSFKLDNCLVAYPSEGFDDVKAVLGQNGFFGLEGQRRFTVTFDYRHSQIYLKPNSRYRDPFEFNMAGLVLRTLRNGAWEVVDILPNSPGSAAGIKKGDSIIAVDGRNCTSIAFVERERIFARENVPMRLSLNRNGSTLNVSFVLSRIL
ncbi:MAG: PDZ domain-containing protein [Candidatus Bathyarchaeota archaeon]|nr:PDZ domain-containing protein [Candidatus Bathyarchaeota archaeon]